MASDREYEVEIEAIRDELGEALSFMLVTVEAGLDYYKPEPETGYTGGTQVEIMKAWTTFPDVPWMGDTAIEMTLTDAEVAEAEREVLVKWDNDVDHEVLLAAEYNEEERVSCRNAVAWERASLAVSGGYTNSKEG